MRAAIIGTIKKFFILILAFSLIAVSLLQSAVSEAAAETAANGADTAKSAATAAEDGAAEEEESLITGRSGIIFCGDTGDVLWEQNADERMEPASVTKLMTALLVVENLDLDQVVTVTAEAAAVIPSKIYLEEGEKITVEELLYGLLLPSGNDAAIALAVATAGSVKSFAEMMNEKAEALGCTNTHFVNPNGLDEPGHYSSARDLALIASASLGNDTVRKISGTAKHTIPATNMHDARDLNNSNFFLTGIDLDRNGFKIKVDKYEGVFGGKTGVVGDNKCTMVTGLDYEGMEIYSVVMGSTLQGRYDDIKALMDYAEKHLKRYEAFKKGDEFDKVKLLGGSTNKVRAVASEDGYIILPPEASPSLVSVKYTYTDSLFAPVKKGQKIGVAEIYLSDELKRSVDLVAAKDVGEGWFLSRFGVTNLQTLIGGAAILLLAAAAVFLLTARKRNRKKSEQLRKERLKEIAMKQLAREKDKKDRNWPY